MNLIPQSYDRRASIVVLTGAGISAESGIRTFRDHDGLWEDHRVEEVASLSGYRANPQLVQSFYNVRRAQLLDAAIQPNPAHIALSRLEREWDGDFLLVTQNVDDLHERAGSKKLIHMHGELLKVRCEVSGKIYVWHDPIEHDAQCPYCGRTGSLRPHIVWFGEIPLMMSEIARSLSETVIFIAIGTSGHVYPAAGFVQMVPEGSWKIEVNREESQISEHFNDQRVGLASELVPKLVEELLGH